MTILMPDRKEVTYKKIIKKLKQASTKPLRPEKILSGFEVGTINVFEEECSKGGEIKNCNFHMTQYVWRKIQQLRFENLY